jgi:hypothetical protein
MTLDRLRAIDQLRCQQGCGSSRRKRAPLEGRSVCRKVCATRGKRSGRQTSPSTVTPVVRAAEINARHIRVPFPCIGRGRGCLRAVSLGTRDDQRGEHQPRRVRIHVLTRMCLSNNRLLFGRADQALLERVGATK